jgi:outer membrane lipoprotein-sorting protein
VTTPSSHPLENLRPNIFYESLILREITPSDLVSLTQQTKTRLDAATGHLMFAPEYELTVVHRKKDSQEIIPERCVHFDRTTLLPNKIDIFNDVGAIETEVTYGPYVSFGDKGFPSTITINRPIDEYQVVISIEKLTLNQPFTPDKFVVTIPDGYDVQEKH